MSRALLLVAVALAAACPAPGPVPAAEYGRQLFSDPTFSDSEFNAFSCATCHAGDAPVEGRIYSGAPLVDSAFREAWWGGYAARYLDAVNHCAVFFMRRVRPMDRDDVKGRALYEYLVSISPSRDEPALPLTVVENVTTVPRGDPRRGEQVYEAACKHCHGAPHTGEGRLDEYVDVIPEASVAFAEENGFEPSLVVIEKVRHGQFFGVGGNMPFFSLEALSDEDLGALIAYLGL